MNLFEHVICASGPLAWVERADELGDLGVMADLICSFVEYARVT